MRARVLDRASRTFSALRVRNYRLYLGGQTVSLTGTWMQSVAMAWLVLKLTGSGTALGFVVAFQFLPVLLFGAWGGVVADRIDKRRLLVCTQTLAGAQALVLGLLTVTGAVELWMVYGLALLFGCINAVDNPTRQSFVLEMSGPEELTNAVTLNSVNVNLARVLGPAIAGVLIRFIGIGPCFLANAASYVAVVGALLAIRRRDLHTSPRQPRRKGQLREGLAYVRRSPDLLGPLLMMAVIGTLAYEFTVILPLLAKFTFHGDAGTLGLMTSAMGLGAVGGGLVTAGRGAPTRQRLVLAATAFGAAILVAAAAPTLPFALLALVAVGAGSITFMAVANSTLQLAAAPGMRGRVMALWGIAFLGSTPVGGPIVGLVGQHLGPRWGLALGGASAVLAGAAAWRWLGHSTQVIEVVPADEAEDAEDEAEDEAADRLTAKADEGAVAAGVHLR